MKSLCKPHSNDGPQQRPELHLRIKAFTLFFLSPSLLSQLEGMWMQGSHHLDLEASGSGSGFPYMGHLLFFLNAVFQPLSCWNWKSLFVLGEESNEPFFLFLTLLSDVLTGVSGSDYKRIVLPVNFMNGHSIWLLQWERMNRVWGCAGHASKQGKEQGGMEQVQKLVWGSKAFARHSWYELGSCLLGGPDFTLNTPVAISITSVTMLLPHPGQTLQINHRVLDSWTWIWLQKPPTTTLTGDITSQQVLPRRCNPSAITSSARSPVSPVATCVPWQPPLPVRESKHSCAHFPGARRTLNSGILPK